MAEYMQVVTTTDSKEAALALAREVVHARLGAAGQIYPIRSVYWWESAVQDEQEWQVVFKRVSRLNEAVKRSHTAKNPPRIAKPPRANEEEIVPFSVAEARQILAAANRVRNGVRFSLALRQGEALGLQWRDIDFSAGALMVSRSLQARTWKHGCSDEETVRKAVRRALPRAP